MSVTADGRLVPMDEHIASIRLKPEGDDSSDNEDQQGEQAQGGGNQRQQNKPTDDDNRRHPGDPSGKSEDS